MKSLLLGIGAAILLTAQAGATEISTHVLDLQTGRGGQDIFVQLLKKEQEQWILISAAQTDENGRVESFGDDLESGLYRLKFDVEAYLDEPDPAFFPEIEITFNVKETRPHYHVPVVLSPYGYSTYRGN